MFRVCMIPVFAGLIYFYVPERTWLRQAALGVYIIVALSDMADGFIARHYNQRTRLGARLDPLADKLIVNLGFVFIAANPNFSPGIPLWFPVFILGRDISIVMGAYLINEHYGTVHVRPRFSGKLSTVFQMATIIGVLVAFPYLWWIIVGTVAVSVTALFGYAVEGSRQVFQKDPA